MEEDLKCPSDITSISESDTSMHQSRTMFRKLAEWLPHMKEPKVPSRIQTQSGLVQVIADNDSNTLPNKMTSHDCIKLYL